MAKKASLVCLLLCSYPPRPVSVDKPSAQTSNRNVRTYPRAIMLILWHRIEALQIKLEPRRAESEIETRNITI